MVSRSPRSPKNFFGDLGLRDTIQERIAPKSIEIDTEKLHIKFSALNVDFDGLSHGFLGLKKHAHEGVKELYRHKSRYLPLLASLS